MTVKESNATLPFEILEKVFKILPIKSLFACLCVCKSWFHPASQIYFRRISIDNDRQAGDIELLALYIQNNHHLAIGSKIRSIKISGQRELKRNIYPRGIPAPSPAIDLRILLQLCPNLQDLAFSSASIYWKHINGMDPLVFDMVRPRRIYILNSSRIAEEEHFYDVAHRFRSSLCELEIYCACDSHISRNFGSLFSYLASFPLLDSLTIKNSSRRNMVYFEKLLDACKHLKYLNFQLDHPFFEREQDFHQPGLEYPSMYELDIYLSNFEPHKLQYLVQRFTHLKKLSLRINQNDKQQKDLESIKHYFRYDFVYFISKLDSFYFDFDIKRRSYLEDLIESSYLPSFLGKISLDISMNSMFMISHGRSEEAQLKITKKEKKHFICYRVVRDFSTLNQAKQQGDTTKQLPYIPHLHLYGQHLQSLDIFITPHAQKYEALTVNSVVDLCPNLQKLSIGVNFNKKSDLPLEHQHPAPHHWVHNPERALKSKLATLIIQGMAISSDIVRAIARQYPNLKNFELLECFPEATDTPDTTYNGRVAFLMYDLSNLHLDLLKFDVRWYRCSKDSVVPQVIVVVEEQDQICRYYLAKYKVMAVDLFQDITKAHFEQAVTSTESPVTVVWLKVKLVNHLMLIADVNKKTPYNIFLHGGSKEEYYNRLYRPS